MCVRLISPLSVLRFEPHIATCCGFIKHSCREQKKPCAEDASVPLMRLTCTCILLGFCHALSSLAKAMRARCLRSGRVPPHVVEELERKHAAHMQMVAR